MIKLMNLFINFLQKYAFSLKKLLFLLITVFLLTGCAPKPHYKVVEQIHIAVNRLRAGMISKGDAVNIDAAMDTSGLPLLGVIPEDKDVIACGNQGQVLVLFSTGYARVAYANIARRLRGTRLPLLEGVKLK